MVDAVKMVDEGLLKVFEVTDNPPSAKGLAVAEVPVPEDGKPHALEGIKVLFANGQHFFVEDPVDNVSTWWVCKRALVVIEPMLAFSIESLEQLFKVDLPNRSEIQWTQLLYERMTLRSNLKEEADHS